MFMLDAVTPYPSQLKNDQKFLDQMLASLVHNYWVWDKRSLKKC